MKLTKEQALDLVKVLSHYQTLESTVDAPTVYATLGSLEKFLLGDNEDLDSCEADDCCDHTDGDDDEEDEEDDEAGEGSSEEEDDEESDESEDDEGDEADDEGEEVDGEGDDEDELSPDSYALGGDLHDLKVAKAKIISSSIGEPDDEVTLEFEFTAGGDDDSLCDLLVSGEVVGPITHVRRKGQELHVAENNSGERAWHRFHVSRFPKGWADTLPLDELIEIE